MRALVVAGGVPQVELIKQLKSRYIETILVDGNPNAIARYSADMFYCENIFDAAAITKIAVKEKVDFLMTVCADQVLLIVAKVSEELGLPCYIDYRTAMDVSDKKRMKKIFVENSIPTSRYIELSELNADNLAGLKFPLVVKPTDAYSSKGVRKVFNTGELEQYYKEAQAISRTGGVIVEEFFNGEELSVDAFVVEGKVHVLSITKSEKICSENRFVIFRGRYPVEISTRLEKKIQDIAQKISDAFKLFNSPLLIQLLYNDESLSVLEFCARTGGNMKWLLIKNSCGVDVISATIDITLGEKPNIAKAEKNAVVVNDFIYCYPGIFDHFEGFDEMERMGIINEFHPTRAKGTRMKGVTSSSDRIAGMNIISDSIDEYNRKRRIILKSVKVMDAEGNDIMRKDLLPELI